ncbi:MAG: response regulator [SAR324 cluster bacterium]|nr:response regulator [SAR324 cluster bacterium]
MSKSILVLEQNPEIQGLIASSLNPEQIEIHQESNPNAFLKRARTLKPDLIFVGNSEEDEGYRTCRGIRAVRALRNTPLVMLSQASDKLDAKRLNELGIEDRIFKPFDASVFEENLRKHLSLRHPFRDEESEPFEHERTEVFDPELTGLMNEVHTPRQSRSAKQAGVSSGKKPVGRKLFEKRNIKEKIMAETQTPNSDQSQAEPLEVIDATEMDSLMLDDDIGDFSTPLEPLTEEELEMEQESAPVEESGNEEPEFSAEPDKPEASSETGLEDSQAANHFSEQEEDELDFEPATSLQGGFSDLSHELPSFEIDVNPDDFSDDEAEDAPQTLREGLTSIDLEVNDFEDPEEIWNNPPDLNQIPRDNLADINLRQNDFDPELPKNLKPLGEPVQQSKAPEKATEEEGRDTQIRQMDDFVIEVDTRDEQPAVSNEMDRMILSEEVSQPTDEVADSMDLDEFMLNSAEESFTKEEEETTLPEKDAEDSASAELALGELDVLNEEMAALEIPDERLPEEDAVEGSMIPQAKTGLEEEVESWSDDEDELREFMLDELEGYLDDEEVKEQLEKELEAEETPIQEPAISKEAPASSALGEVSPRADTLGDWETGDDAFMKFDRFDDEEFVTSPPAAESELKQEELVAEPVAVSQMFEEPALESAADTEIVLDGIEGRDRLVEEPVQAQVEMPVVFGAPEEETPGLKIDLEELQRVVAQSVQQAVQSIMPSIVDQVMDQVKLAQEQRI